MFEMRCLTRPFPNLPSAPPQVWIEGLPSAFQLLERLPAHGLAVVGTRAPQKRTELLTRSVIGKLRGSDLILLSGLARGIDAIAHEAALAAGLPTIAVLAHGLEQTYPPENSALRTRILQAGGLVLSEFPPGTEAKRSHFIQRNRIIAGLAQATWIVQAGRKSGALNTATWATRQNRTVYATAGFPGDPALAGNEWLLTQRQATALWSMDELSLTWMGLIRFFGENAREKPDADPLQSSLLLLESRLREGASLSQALFECSVKLGIPVTTLLQDFENAQNQA